MASAPPSATQAARLKAQLVAGTGALAIGLLLLIGGLVLHGHYEPIKQLCDTGLVQLAQTFDTAAQPDCGTDSLLAEAGTVLTFIGGVIAGTIVMVALGALAQTRSGRKA